MTTIKINDIEYQIPTNWDDITLQQQIDVSIMRNRDEDFRTLFMIHTYTGIPMEILRKMNINHFKSILSLMSFLSENPKGKSIKHIDHNGNRYFLADSVLKGETQDFLSIEAVLKKYKDNQTMALPYIIAIVCKRQDETLSDYDAEQRAEEFKTLPYQTAMDVWFFFAQTERYFSQNIKAFLEVQGQVLEASLSYTESLMKKQVGLVWYKRFLRTILLLYMRYIRKDWTSFYRTYLSRISDQTLKREFKTK